MKGVVSGFDKVVKGRQVLTLYDFALVIGGMNCNLLAIAGHEARRKSAIKLCYTRIYEVTARILAALGTDLAPLSTSRVCRHAS